MKELTRIVEVVCPYCEHKNKMYIDVLSRIEIVTCDCDEGGCDKDFVVLPKIVCTVDVKKIAD